MESNGVNLNFGSQQCAIINGGSDSFGRRILCINIRNDNIRNLKREVSQLKRDLKDSRKQNARLINTVEAQATTTRYQLKDIQRMDKALKAKEREIQRLNRLIEANNNRPGTDPGVIFQQVAAPLN